MPRAFVWLTRARFAALQSARHAVRVPHTMSADERDVFAELEELGLVRGSYSSDPPGWVLTKAGRDAVDNPVSFTTGG